MKGAGGLHPARPDWWPPTKWPPATAGGLIAASVTNLSRREGVPPCLRTSVISWGIGASQKLSRRSLLDLSELQHPRTLGYLLLFGLYFKRKAYC